jgi:hypothetical protein
MADKREDEAGRAPNPETDSQQEHGGLELSFMTVQRNGVNMSWNDFKSGATFPPAPHPVSDNPTPYDPSGAEAAGQRMIEDQEARAAEKQARIAKQEAEADSSNAI